MVLLLCFLFLLIWLALLCFWFVVYNIFPDFSSFSLDRSLLHDNHSPRICIFGSSYHLTTVLDSLGEGCYNYYKCYFLNVSSPRMLRNFIIYLDLHY